MKLRPGIISAVGAGGGGGGGGGGTVGAPTYNWQSTYRHSIGDIDNILPNAAAQDGDVMLMFVENGGSDGTVFPTGGWAHVALSPVADTTGSSALQTRLSCFWRRFVAPGDATPNWDIDGEDQDHVSAVILGFRNVKGTGNPWNITSVGTAGSAITSITVPGLTTTVANCLVVVGVSTSREFDGTAEFTGWTNASLASITEVFDATDSAGDGTGIGVACGVKTAAGVVSSTAVTSADPQRHAYITVALAPAS